jgi:hypothetical protein
MTVPQKNGPSPDTRKSSRSPFPILRGQRRFEHWYRDNQVYFITARCRDGFPAFETEQAKSIFWDRFERYATEFTYTPWITCLLDNHYHTLGYLKNGNSLGEMMRRIHGSVAKLVNDVLPVRLRPFWRGDDGHDYFDGCLRDETQLRRTYRYIWSQPRRHGLAHDCATYPHTRVTIDVEHGVGRALELGALLTGVPYRRYHARGD